MKMATCMLSSGIERWALNNIDSLKVRTTHEMLRNSTCEAGAHPTCGTHPSVLCIMRPCRTSLADHKVMNNEAEESRRQPVLFHSTSLYFSVTIVLVHLQSGFRTMLQLSGASCSLHILHRTCKKTHNKPGLVPFKIRHLPL